MSDLWLEARLIEGGQPWALYSDSELGAVTTRRHHFYGEPWWPKGAVVRLQVTDEIKAADALREIDQVDHWIVWEGVEDDRELYGEGFEYAMEVFEGASLMTAMAESQEWRCWTRDKLVHCILNANGGGDLKWALRFAWKRLKLDFYLRVLKKDPMKYHQAQHVRKANKATA